MIIDVAYPFDTRVPEENAGPQCNSKDLTESLFVGNGKDSMEGLGISESIGNDLILEEEEDRQIDRQVGTVVECQTGSINESP